MGVIKRLTDVLIMHEKENRFKRAICDDCEGLYRCYMATDEIWKKAKLACRDNVCRACLSIRLGRILTPDDFINVPVNWWNVPGFYTEQRLMAWAMEV